jgi:hypothetical protein
LAVAYAALAGGDRVMIRVLGGAGRPPSTGFLYGRHRIVEMAHQLGALTPAGEVDLAPALAREMVSIRRAGKVFLVSDFLAMINSVERALGMFTAANMDVSAVQILGKSELEGQGLQGDVEVIDAESGERLRVSLGPRERERYRHTLQRLSREIRNFCLRRGLRYALHTTDQNFHDFFLSAATGLGLVH